MMIEEPNPYTPPPIFSFKVNLTKVRDWWRKRKERKSLTEAELYDKWKEEKII